MSTPSATGSGGSGGRPENVGILAADVYFPSTFVAQVTWCMCVRDKRGGACWR